MDFAFAPFPILLTHPAAWVRLGAGLQGKDRTMRLLCAVICLLLLAFPPLLSGCGEALDGPLPHILDLRPEGEQFRGLVPLAYRLADGGVPVQVDVFVSLDGGAFTRATPAPGSISGRGVIPDSGAEYVFLWDSLADTGYAAREAVLRLLVRNPYGRAMMTGEPLRIQNDNQPPQVSFGPRRINEDGSLNLSVGVADPEGDEVELLLLVSVNHGEPFAATLRDAPGRLDAPARGRTLSVTWEAGADLPPGGSRHVTLHVSARDRLGPGHTRRSGPFAVYPELPLSLDLRPTPPTQRGDIPLFYSLSGPLGTLVTLEAAIKLTDTAPAQALTPAASFQDSLRNRRASPEGSTHELIWNSLADLEAPIVRNLRVRLSITHVDGVKLPEPLHILGNPLDVDNAPLSAGPLISEVFPGLLGPDSFVELVAVPGTSLNKIRLYRIFKDGSTGEATGRAFLPLDGQQVGDSGVFVISGPLGPPGDLLWDNIGEFFPDREPFTLVLHLAESDYFYDAVGIGDFKNAVNSAGSKGDGDPVAYPPPGLSLHRRLANSNARQNTLDFVFDSPDPGVAQLWALWP